MQYIPAPDRPILEQRVETLLCYVLPFPVSQDPTLMSFRRDRDDVFTTRFFNRVFL